MLVSGIVVHLFFFCEKWFRQGVLSTESQNHTKSVICWPFGDRLYFGKYKDIHFSKGHKCGDQMKHPFGKSWLTMAWGQHPSEWSRDFTEVLCHCQQRAVESALVGDLVLWGQFLEAWKCNGMDSHSQDFSEKVADQLGCDRPWNHLKSGFRFLNQAARLYTVYLLRWHLVASKTSWILSVVWWLGTCCTCVYIVYRDNRYIHIYIYMYF